MSLCLDYEIDHQGGGGVVVASVATLALGANTRARVLDADSRARVFDADTRARALDPDISMG